MNHTLAFRCAVSENGGTSRDPSGARFPHSPPLKPLPGLARNPTNTTTPSRGARRGPERTRGTRGTTSRGREAPQAVNPHGT